MVIKWRYLDLGATVDDVGKERERETKEREIRFTKMVMNLV